MRKLAGSLILCVLITSGVSAQMSLGARLETSGGLFLDGSREFQDPLVLFQLTPEYASDGFSARAEMMVSGAFAVHGIPSWTFGLGEAYIIADLFEGFSLTAGRRIISWGTALTANPVGFVNPVSFAEQLTSDRRADWLIPVSLLAAKYIRGPLSAEAVYIPFFVPNEIPGALSRWYPADLRNLTARDGTPVPGMPASTYEVTFSQEYPEFEIGSSQAAGRLGLSLGVIDAGLSGFYGYAKNPAVEGAMDMSGFPPTVGLDFSADYRRQGAVGLDLSVSLLGSSVAWLEAALVLPEYYARPDAAGLPETVEKNTLNTAFGLDRTVGLGSAADLYVAAEGTFNRLFAYEDGIPQEENEFGASLITEVRSVSQDLTFRVVLFEPDFLTLSDTSQFLVRASAAVRVLDGVSFTLGAVLFGGSGGYVGQYDENDFLHASIRASF